MDNDNYKKRIFLKIIIIFVFLGIYIIMNLPKTGYKNLPSNTLVNYNVSSYTDYIYSYLDIFVQYLEKNEYEQAFNMLTEECKKKVFDNNIHNFSNKIKSKYIDNSIAYKRVGYDLKKEFIDVNENKNYFVETSFLGTRVNENYKGTVEQAWYFQRMRSISIYVIEYSPFNYKLDLVIEDKEF